MKLVCAILGLVLTINVFSQVPTVNDLDKKFLNWHLNDYANEHIVGTSVEKAYTELLKERKPKKQVIVAIIDSGVDIYHEDLKANIWVNEKEVANNGIDDDNNGYVDDIHGWNFLGNKAGQNIFYENLEYVRILKQGEFNNDYREVKDLYKKELDKKLQDKADIERFDKAYQKAKLIIKNNTGIDVRSMDDINKVSSYDEQVINARNFIRTRFENGFKEEMLKRWKSANEEAITYYLNMDFNPREIVGDDPLNIDDRDYGNADVKGPRSNHGTSVAGIVAATRNNSLGINGIAQNVKIMSLRTTPMGDERDKDVALAIIYAVKNGADIINMSFGKDFSPQKNFVDAAVKFAEENDVLIVHGAGNESENIDENDRFPSDRYLDGSEATNWINVGATSMELGEKLVSDFSNFGNHHVDIFAPGSDLISLDSSNTYSMNSGTSLAAPVVTGVAALVLSYYPELSSKDLIEILLHSSFKQNRLKVILPSKNDENVKKVRFETLSKSAGIINAYEALKAAQLIEESRK